MLQMMLQFISLGMSSAREIKHSGVLMLLFTYVCQDETSAERDGVSTGAERCRLEAQY